MKGVSLTLPTPFTVQHVLKAYDQRSWNTLNIRVVSTSVHNKLIRKMYHDNATWLRWLIHYNNRVIIRFKTNLQEGTGLFNTNVTTALCKWDYWESIKYWTLLRAHKWKNIMRKWKNKKMSPTWFEHATFWSGVRRATVAPQAPHLPKNTYNTWDSQAVTHPSTNQARRCLTSVIRREPVYSAWYGRRQQQRFKKWILI